MIRKSVVCLLSLLVGCNTLFAQDIQRVYIDGVKYDVYAVVQGDTLYSLSKRFGVTIDQITAANPSLAEGLKAGQTIKIPQPQPTTKNKKADKRSKRDFRVHIVRKGDTLYSISRLYEISVDALIADNDNVDPAQLAIGQSLYIRRNAIGLTTEEQSHEQMVQQQQTMNSVISISDYSYHLVHKGESADSIASRFGTTIDALLALNNFRAAEYIREGLIIKVPNRPQEVATEPSQQTAEPEQSVTQSRLEQLSSNKRAEVALMLPLGKGGVASQSYLDFYQGFLLGADHLRIEGIESHINLFNTAHDLDKVTQIIEQNKLESANLIVGPVYEDTLIPVARYAERRNVPVVSPLANLTQSNATNLFQMSPRPENKFEKVTELFDGSRRVVFITSDTTDKVFEAEVKQALGATPYTTHKYIYEHPSEIEKRIKAAAEGQEVPPSPSDLSPLLEGQDSSLFVILAATEVEVDRILAALASASISLKAKSIKCAPYMVFGNNKWNRYKNLDHALFFTNNVVMLSTYHIDRSDKHIRDFASNYIKSFGSLPTLYSYRGYDAAMIFIHSLYDDIENGLAGKKFMPLQTPYTFVEDRQSKVRVNSEWVRVNYNSNFTITAQ